MEFVRPPDSVILAGQGASWSVNLAVVHSALQQAFLCPRLSDRLVTGASKDPLSDWLQSLSSLPPVLSVAWGLVQPVPLIYQDSRPPATALLTSESSTV